ncbi:MAG: hypothetical protein ACMUIG_07090, partial [Thermoplasmatota archaeon]
IIRLMDLHGNINMSTEVTISISDDDRPEFQSFMTDDTGFTGDSFLFMVSIADNIAMNSAYVVYRFGSGDPVNASLDLDTDYYLSIVIPGDSLDPIYYQFFAFDINGNWANSTETMVTILDNDLPFLIGDSSDDEAFTGDVFNFDLEAGDNIGISSVHVVYSIGEGESTNVTMEVSDGFSATVQIPDGAQGDLKYRFVFMDTSGNWNGSSEIVIPIIDNDPPVLIRAEFDSEEYGTGDTVVLEVEWEDNIGIDNATAEYWFGSGDHENAELSLSGSAYVFEIELPIDSLEDLSIIIRIVDGSGNENSTSYTISYTDTIAPTIDPIDDIEIYLGDEIDLTGSASDNIAVSGYEWTGLPDAVTGSRLKTVIEQTGIYSMTLTVADPSGNSAEEDFTISVFSRDRDRDQDGIPDLDEIDRGMDPDDETDGALDPDDDGMTNAEEFSAGTDMNDPDTDGDGMPDGWEFGYDLDPLTASAENDEDLDGILDLDEYLGGTDPRVSNDDDGGLDSVLLFIIIGSILLVVILLIIIGIIIFVKSRKKKGEEEEEEKEETAEWDN